MRAKIRTIEPQNSDASWETFVREQKTRPQLNDFAQFTLLIGPEEEAGADIFHVWVSTPAAASRARQGRHFKGLIIESFEPDLVRKTLEAFVASLESETWQGVTVHASTPDLGKQHRADTTCGSYRNARRNVPVFRLLCCHNTL